MSRPKTDYRAAKARRDAAMARPELSRDPKPAGLDTALIAAAVAAGRLTKVPAGKRGKR
jgi:hypothetical protein